MIRIALQVTYDDNRTETIIATAADAIAFEREYDKPISVLNSGRMEYMWWIGWRALTRHKKTELPFDEWLDTVAELKDEEVDDIVPLERSQSTGS
jgi:hypothetical protein